MFTDRQEAGKRLVRPLAKYRGQRPLVAAIPRGAVVPGRVIAGALGGDLDVVFVRKLRAPGCDEVAVGAVDERGKVYSKSEIAKAKASGAKIDYVDPAVWMEKNGSELLRLSLTGDRPGDLAMIVNAVTDAYLEEWRRASRPCGVDLEAEVAAAAAALDREYPDDRLASLVTALGEEEPG